MRLKGEDGSRVEDDNSKADILNRYFCSVFTEEEEGNGSEGSTRGENGAEMDTSPFTRERVLKELEVIRVDKAMGPDGVHPRVLKELREVVAEPLAILFSQSLETGEVPKDWRTADVVPLYKSGNKEEAGNYRPVSLTSVVGKIMEALLKERLVEHLVVNGLQDPRQHGFTRGRSCQTNLVEFFDWVTREVDQGRAVDMAYLDFSKAFDTVPHRRLLHKLGNMGVGRTVVWWVGNWLGGRTQRVVVNGCHSTEGRVTSGVPQGSVLGPVLFNIFISDIAQDLEGRISLFADDTKLCNRVDTPEGVDRMRSDLQKLEEWSGVWQLKFNAKKCKIMHMGHKNPGTIYQLGGEDIACTKQERDLGVIISDDLKVGKQCDKAAGKANRMLGCIGRGITSRKREVIIPLYKTLVRPHLEYSVQFWRPYLRKDIDRVEKVQRRATKMVHGLHHKSYEDRLKELNMYSLEERRERGDMIETYKYLTGRNRVQENTIFKRKRCSRTRGHGMKLEGGRFRGNMRKNFFTERVVDKWNTLPEEVVGAETITGFKNAWDRHKGILEVRGKGQQTSRKTN